jgi:hypothetical protein
MDGKHFFVELINFVTLFTFFWRSIYLVEDVLATAKVLKVKLQNQCTTEPWGR